MSAPAFWITADSWQLSADPIRPHPIALRWDFSLPGEIEDGEIEATASHFYVLWINGRRAMEGPARAYPKHRFLDRLRLKDWLRPGANAIAVLLLPPPKALGYGCPTRSGFFLRGFCHGAGFQKSLVSSSDWKAHEADWISSRGWFLSLAAGPQEHWDFRAEPKNWRRSTPRAWKPAWALGPEGTPPWELTPPSPIARQQAEPAPATLLWAGDDARRKTPRATNPALAFGRRRFERTHAGVARAGAVYSNETANVFVFDLGKTRPFRPGVELSEVSGDVEFELFYDTEWRGSPAAMRGFGTATEGFCDSFRPDGRKLRWESLRMRGGRFVVIRVAGTGRCRFRPRIANLEYPFEGEARFECAEKWLAECWRISASTLRSSATDAIVDTCARENMLWTFDACVAGKAMFHTFGDSRLWRHCLWLIGCGVDERGIPSAVVPSSPSFMCLFDQTMQWVYSCHEYAELSGDASLTREIAGPLERFLDQCAGHLTEEGLFVPPAYAWHWVDWAPLDRRACSLPINAAFLRCCRAAAAIARAGGSARLARKAGRLFRMVRAASDRFYDEGAGLYADHVAPLRAAGPENPFMATPAGEALVRSMHGNLQMAGLLARGARRRTTVLNGVLPWLARPDQPVSRFGPGWTQILLQPLVESGHARAVLEFIRTRFAPFLEVGAPTWAEGFEATPHNSAHGWGGALNSLVVEGLVGLRPAAPGWKTVAVDPRLDCDFAYELETAAGRIGLERERGRLALLLPRRMDARHGVRSLRGDGAWKRL